MSEKVVTLNDALVQSIADLTRKSMDEVRIDKDGRIFSTKKFEEVIVDAVGRADALRLDTLESFVEFMAQETGFNEKDGGRLVYVADCNEVRLLGPLAGWPRPYRQMYAIASCRTVEEDGGTDGDSPNYRPIESFLLFLRTQFVLTDQMASLLLVLGNAQWEQGISQTDDGVGQTIASRAGTVIPTAVNLPKLIPLRPYRTFRELDQPESDFILRTKGDPQRGVYAALIEADGGKWRLEAQASIKAWFKERGIVALG